WDYNSETGGGWTYRFDPSNGKDPKAVKNLNVKFDVDVRMFDPKDARATTPSDDSNYIRVEEMGNDPETGVSVVNSGNRGVRRSKPLLGPTLDDDNPAAHEFGHIVGLDDRYNKHGAHKGWEGNIMADHRGVVEQRNIDRVLKNALRDYKGEKQYT